MLHQLEERFRGIVAKADFCSLRFYHQRDESISVRQDVPEPIGRNEDMTDRKFDSTGMAVAWGGGVGLTDRKFDSTGSG